MSAAGDAPRCANMRGFHLAASWLAMASASAPAWTSSPLPHTPPPGFLPLRVHVRVRVSGPIRLAACGRRSVVAGMLWADQVGGLVRGEVDGVSRGFMDGLPGGRGAGMVVTGS